MATTVTTCPSCKALFHSRPELRSQAVHLARTQGYEAAAAAVTEALAAEHEEHG